MNGSVQVAVNGSVGDVHFTMVNRTGSRFTAAYRTPR